MYPLAAQEQGTSGVYLDPSACSRALCKAGIIVCWLAGLLCLGLGTWLVHQGGAYLSLKEYEREISPLALNVLVTFINETLGYIHTNSLRWALQREGRLTFNSNLRLITSARTSKANAWYANLCMLLCIVMVYASTSLILMGDYPVHTRYSAAMSESDPFTTFVCGYALVTLAIGILGQCIVATAALHSTVSSPTWSSNPIDTAAACVTVGAIAAVPGRCLRSVHDKEHVASPAAPSSRQAPAYHAHKEVRLVLFSLWGTVAICLLWGCVLIGVIHRLQLVNGMYYGYSWALFPNIPSSVELSSAPAAEDDFDTSGTMTLAVSWHDFSFPSFCWAFALFCLLQTVMTLSLHCAELLVNVVRDEKTWRRAGSPSGGFHREPGLPRKPTNALQALLASGPALTLFLFKPVLHWIYGLAVSTYFSVGLVMRPPQIIYLSMGAVLLAAFVSGCAFWRPKGPQPATFGHLQTLTNLIDEWPEVGETMFWGRKGELRGVESGSEEESVRPLLTEPDGAISELGLSGEKRVAHAGTSTTKLEEIRLDELYMGIQSNEDAIK